MTPKEWQPTPETKNAKSKSLKRFVAFCPECGGLVEVSLAKAKNKESRYCDKCVPTGRFNENKNECILANRYMEKLQARAFDKVYKGISRHDRTPEDRMLSLAKAVVVTSDENFGKQARTPTFRKYLEMEYESLGQRFRNPKTRLRTKRNIQQDMAEIEDVLKLLSKDDVGSMAM